MRHDGSTPAASPRPMFCGIRTLISIRTCSPVTSCRLASRLEMPTKPAVSSSRQGHRHHLRAQAPSPAPSRRRSRAGAGAACSACRRARASRPQAARSPRPRGWSRDPGRTRSRATRGPRRAPGPAAARSSSGSWTRMLRWASEQLAVHVREHGLEQRRIGCSRRHGVDLGATGMRCTTGARTPASRGDRIQGRLVHQLEVCARRALEGAQRRRNQLPLLRDELDGTIGGGEQNSRPLRGELARARRPIRRSSSQAARRRRALASPSGRLGTAIRVTGTPRRRSARATASPPSAASRMMARGCGAPGSIGAVAVNSSPAG